MARPILCAIGFSLVVSAAAFGGAVRNPFSAVLAAAPVPTCDGLTATIVGTSGDDVIQGTSGDDVIVGLQGDDRIRGGLGDDVICGGPGNDVLEGSGGDDVLFGDEDDDVLDGGQGGCCLFVVNTGDDVLYGGAGNDELHTSDFPVLGNTLYGEQGDDSLFVWSGGWAYGGNGDDEISQFAGDAWLEGDNGDDSIVDWNDFGISNETVVMIGGNGDDELVSEDASSVSDADGERGADACTADTTNNCEG